MDLNGRKLTIRGEEDMVIIKERVRVLFRL